MIETMRNAAGSTLVARCEDALAEPAARVLELLRREMEETGCPSPRDGLRIQVAWTVFTLIADGPHLRVCEPDFANDPHVGHREDITRSLAVLGSQNSWSR